MSLKTKDRKDQNNRTPLPEIKAGTYMGRIVSVVDVGVQPQEDYETKEEKPPKEECFIAVEFPKLRMERDEEDLPRWLSKKFKVMGPQEFGYENSNVKKMLENLMEDGDWSTLVDVPVMCSIAHTVTGNPKIVSMTSVPEGVEVPALENEAVVFDFYDPDLEVFNKLPAFMQKITTEAVDFSGSDLERLLDSVS